MRIKETSILLTLRFLLFVLMGLFITSCDWMKTDFAKCSDRVIEEYESCEIRGNNDCATKALRGQKYCGDEYGE